MKRLLILVLTLCAFLEIATAATLTEEQKDVQAFIKKLYAVDSLTFEYGYFGKKYDPAREKREIYPKFFTKDLLTSVEDLHSLNGFLGMRHPSASVEDLSQISGRTVTKNPKMRPPVVNDDRAYVDVYPDNGRTIYFLKKSSDGWRIFNTAYYDVWPRNDGTCWEPIYLVTPTPEQQALETEECIKYRQSQLGKK